MQIHNITIFIDESGTLPDPDDKVIVIAAVGTSSSSDLLDVTLKVRKHLQRSKKNIQEIKFYRSGDKTKIIFLKELVKKSVNIFTLSLQKDGQRISDSPENFAIICWLLLKECFLFYKDMKKTIIFDKHFHRRMDRNTFNTTLKVLLQKNITIHHVDSMQDTRINAADFVAGSTFLYRKGKNTLFYTIIQKKLVCEKIMTWKEAKRRFIAKVI